MKKNCEKNCVTYTLTDVEKENILGTYNILEKLFTALDDCAGDFEPQDGEIFRARINGDEPISLDGLEDLIVMMETITSVDYISCDFENEDDCD